VGASCKPSLPSSVSFPLHRQDEDVDRDSFIILIFGAWPITFHSSALCSMRRNVLKAQLAFAAEPGNFNCSAKSPVIGSTRKPATGVALSRPPLLTLFLELTDGSNGLAP
jgi:hypothetical protein